MELKKTLIIDGDETSRNYLSLMLWSEAFSIDLAASAKKVDQTWKDRPEVEKMLGFQVRMTMPDMDDNFTVANNRQKPVLLKSTTEFADLVMEQISGQIVEMSHPV